jgi:hypothetical protein
LCLHGTFGVIIVPSMVLSIQLGLNKCWRIEKLRFGLCAVQNSSDDDTIAKYVHELYVICLIFKKTITDHLCSNGQSRLENNILDHPSWHTKYSNNINIFNIIFADKLYFHPWFVCLDKIKNSYSNISNYLNLIAKKIISVM